MRWLFRAWPPMWVVLVAVIIYGIFSLPYVWVVSWCSADVAAEFLAPRDIILSVAAVVYGLYRVQAFHPAARSDYRTWLARTPWHAGIALPIGPVHPVMQDAVMLGLLVAARHASWTFQARHLFEIAIPMMLAYQIQLGKELWRTGYRGLSYGVGAGMALSLRVASIDPWWALAATSAVTCLAVTAFRRSLVTFPWQPPIELIESRWQQTLKGRKPGAREPASVGTSDLGWPFSKLNPADPPPLLKSSDKIAISILAGLFAHAMLQSIHIGPRGAAGEVEVIGSAMVGFAVAFGAAIRLAAYLAHCWPPISLWGRLRTGRWIIPGYDIMFVAPLALFLVPSVLSVALPAIGVASEIAYPIMLVVVLLIAQLAGPSLRCWRLTAPCRVTSGFSPFLTGTNIYERV